MELVAQLAAQTALTTSEGTLYPLLARLGEGEPAGRRAVAAVSESGPAHRPSR